MGQDAILKKVARVSLMRKRDMGKGLKEMEGLGQVIIWELNIPGRRNNRSVSSNFKNCKKASILTSEYVRGGNIGNQKTVNLGQIL